jgi:hypothetical protein
VVVDFAHVPAIEGRGVGQKASDLGNGFGMCHGFHMEQESLGWKRFAAKYSINPRAIADEVAEAFCAKFEAKERAR